MTSALLAVTTSTAFWYLARGTGVVALLLLTLTLVGGIVTSVRWSSERMPRFVTQLLHRNVSLLAFVFICLHVASVVLDGFAPIRWLDAIVPFRSPYRPLWLGLGAVAFDLLLALIVTSLLRHRIGQRTWRVVHWSAYLCWPLVLVHGLGAGSDAKSGLMLVTSAACIVAVIGAVWWRLAVAAPEHNRVRVAGLAATIVAPLALVLWMAGGPLASGWAARAGTPTALLGGGAPGTATATASSPETAARLPDAPFVAGVDGVVTRTPSGNGRLTVDLSLQMSGGAEGYLDLALSGEPTGQGGVYMDSSLVRMGSSPRSLSYEGRVTSLDGSTIHARLRGAGGRTVDLTAGLEVHSGRRVTGQVRVDGARGGSGSGESGSERDEHSGGGDQE